MAENLKALCNYGDDDTITSMDIFINEIRTCQLASCGIDFPVAYKSRSRRKFCCDSHRKYAWKKKNWDHYLAWQREYSKKTKSPV